LYAGFHTSSGEDGQPKFIYLPSFLKKLQSHLTQKVFQSGLIWCMAQDLCISPSLKKFIFSCIGILNSRAQKLKKMMFSEIVDFSKLYLFREMRGVKKLYTQKYKTIVNLI